MSSMEKKKQEGYFDGWSQLVPKRIPGIHRSSNGSRCLVITCGSVDDGKSTPCRMLYEAQLIFDDQVASLQSDSKSTVPRRRN